MCTVYTLYILHGYYSHLLSKLLKCHFFKLTNNFQFYTPQISYKKTYLFEIVCEMMTNMVWQHTATFTLHSVTNWLFGVTNTLLSWCQQLRCSKLENKVWNSESETTKIQSQKYVTWTQHSQLSLPHETRNSKKWGKNNVWKIL